MMNFIMNELLLLIVLVLCVDVRKEGDEYEDDDDGLANIERNMNNII